MITITLSPIRRPGRRGFTLVEVMISAALSSFILAGVLSTFLFLGRSGANLRNYADMETQARRGLEIFAEDVRQASAITWDTETQCTLTVNTASVVYDYDSGSSSLRRNGTAIITGITAGTFAFSSFNVTGTEMGLDTAAKRTIASSSTKQLQITLEATRTNTTVVDATNTVLSARFILRNKIVTA